jgi:hypothetical protein
MRERPSSFVVFIALVIVCVAAYAISTLWPRARDSWQIGFGVAAALAMLGVTLYAVRRRLPGRPLGPASVWLRWHLYGGLLFELLVLMHTRFRMPVGALNLLLWAFALWLTISGLLGVWIQRWIPRAIASGLANEVHYDRIPELVRRLASNAEAFVASCSEPIQSFYQTNLAAIFASPQPSLTYYADVTGGRHSRQKQFQYLARALGGEERTKLDRLERMFQAKLELDAHYSLQRALRWWLVAHVPIAVILVMVVTIHVYFALRY